MSEMSVGARAAWEQWHANQIIDAPTISEALAVGNRQQEQAYAAGFAAALAAIEREAAKLDKASSDESLSRESRILFISQASAVRMAIWAVNKGQEANKR